MTLISCSPMKRACVIGTTGSGKTTLARQLGQTLGYASLDLDDVYYGPNWLVRPLAELRRDVTEFSRAPAWVISGNYPFLRDIVWSRADTLIWLDYPLHVVLKRLIGRTVREPISGKRTIGGNRVNGASNFWGRDSIWAWSAKAIHLHGHRRREIPMLLKLSAFQHLALLVFVQPNETDRWRQGLTHSARDRPGT